jgi:hypothetical protein
MVIDRHLLGDVAVAILLALPTVALARPQPVAKYEALAVPLVEQAAIAQSTSERRFSVQG